MEEMKELILKRLDKKVGLLSQHKVACENAGEMFDFIMANALERIGQTYQPSAEYDVVKQWLTNSNKGLLLQGKCGTGKSLIARIVIPTIFESLNFLSTSSTHMQDRMEDLLSWKCCYAIIDDIGTEFDYIQFGQRRMLLNEIVENFEMKHGILVLTTNLTDDMIREKYGERVLDRIRGNMVKARFNGDSNRV